MDSGVVQSSVHESDQHHPHNVGLEQGEADEHPQDHEKNSVLKKVKAKAKKIKDTIKKHAHHDHDHDREQHDIPDDHDLDEEDDEDEDRVENPEVHGAPIYDSTVPRTMIPGEQVVHHQEPKVVVVSPGIGNDQKVANDSTTRTFTAEEGNTGQQKVNLQKPLDLEEDPAAPGTRHPHTASNYQSKVTDPTGAGGAEIPVTPVLKSFAQMNVHDGAKQYPEPHVRSTATQYPSGTPIPYEEQKHYESMDKPSIQSSYTATQSPSGTPIVHEEQKLYESMDKPPIESTYTETQSPSGAPIVHEEQKLYERVDQPLNQSSYMTTQYPSGISEMEIDQSSYTDKVSSATSATADKTVTAKNAVASKLGYGDNKDNRDHENEQTRGENQSSYTDKISSATSAEADKAVSAKNAVTSKLGYGDNRADRDNEKEGRPGENQTSYTEKISSAPSAIADKAVSDKNVVASKLGYGDNKVERDHEKEASHGENQRTSYTDKISYATSAIANKAVSAKNAITSKLGYGENRADRDNEKETSQGENQTSYTQRLSSAPSAIACKAVSAKNAMASKLGYGDNEDDRENEKETRQGENQSSYTEKLSYATSEIADKDVSAKNAVTSKLGYGSGSGGDNARTTHEDHPKTEDNASTAEYGKKITESLTEKLSPVYSKVAGLGITVKSRLSPSSTNETDKGVSVKDYFAEKLRPGDEDSALFEVISEALHKRVGGGEASAAAQEGGGDNHEGRKVTDVISDVIHDRDERLVETEHRPLGKVTESEEVKRRLGGESESERRYEESYENSSEKGVVGKLKDTVGSWFGTSSQENQSSSQGGRKLQESSN